MQAKIVVFLVTANNRQDQQLANDIVFALDQVRAKNIGVIVGIRTSYKEAMALANKLGASVVTHNANNANRRNYNSMGGNKTPCQATIA